MDLPPFQSTKPRCERFAIDSKTHYDPPVVEAPVFDLSDDHAAAFCPACGAGYTAGYIRCADCDTDLLPRSEIEARLAVIRDEDVESSSLEEREIEEASRPLPEFDLADPDAVAYCPSCGSGFRVGLARCVDCDQELLSRSWVEARMKAPEVGPHGVDQPVVLAEVDSSFKAHMLGSAFQDEGIWFATESSSWGAVRFLVLPRDLDLAQQVLSDFGDFRTTLLEPPEES